MSLVEWMMTASSMRSPWLKLAASTFAAFVDSGSVVRVASAVKAVPMSEPIATTDATRTSPQAARTRHGW